ncbi:MAG: hypothetical protein ACRC46_07470 [Thermoguttaceae bacterium]
MSKSLCPTSQQRFCRIVASVFLFFVGTIALCASFPPSGVSGGRDWLVHPIAETAELSFDAERNEIVMQNGLIRRVWRTQPNGACVRFDNIVTGESLLRGVKPEATLVINEQPFNVGGLAGQPNYAFLLDSWLDSDVLKADGGFRLVDWKFGKTKERFAWKKKRYLPKTVDAQPYPPAGVSLELVFRWNPETDPPSGDSPEIVTLRDALASLEVRVYYEMYDGIPLMAKTVSVTHNAATPITINRLDTEILAFVEGEHSVESRMKLTDAWTPAGNANIKTTSPFVPHAILSNGLTTGTALPKVHVESEYEFIGMDAKSANEVVRWEPDPQFATQVNYERITPCLLKSGLVRLNYVLKPAEVFEAPWTYELIHDSNDRERCGLAQRRMYRLIAPWTAENPILMHVSSVNEDAVKLAIDHCAEVGFEMVILTFGSGFNIENDSPEYLQYITRLVQYANDKGIELGGYSLLGSRSEGEANDVVNPVTGKPGGFARFGSSPCIGSAWGEKYFERLYKFYEATGFHMLEHDGSYPGDYCGSTSHPGHHGLDDSQYTQWKTITDFYRWCRGRGIYLNVPDWYFLNGTNKTGMGYRETNWSLPRAQQVIHGRQNIFDGTWNKLSSMGWMFVPLTQYHGGGAAATMEPLSENLVDYERHLANNFGAGVQACYRGPRLYDTETTKAVVERYVAFYRQYRDILDSDIIHLRRADGRDIDYFLHVNPQLPTKGLLMLYNPTDKDVKRTITVPLYYTGLTDVAKVTEREEKQPQEYSLNRHYEIELPVTVPAGGCSWYVIE